MIKVRHLDCVVTLLAVLAPVASSMPALAQSASLEMTPAGAWSLDYADNTCALSRRFTSAEGEVTLQIEQNVPGHGYVVTLASTQFTGGHGTVRFIVGPGTEERLTENPQRGRAEGTSAVRFGDVLLPERPEGPLLADPASIARYREIERTITNLEFDNALERPMTLQVGSLANALDALRTCVDDLLVSWGMDPASAALVATPAVRVGQIQWARRTNEEYPREMMREGRGASVNIVLAIAPDGRVSGCHAHNPQPYPDFEVAACAALSEYARYEPARNTAGNAVPSFDTMTVVYALGN